MNVITTTLTTKAHFSDDGKCRYLLQKVWDEKLPKLTVIMLVPSGASGIELDTTTQLVINNAARLGYGTLSIVNLFSRLNDTSLKYVDEDKENMKYILNEAKAADMIVYAPGVGKAKNKAFQERQKQVLCELKGYEGKLNCLCDADGNAKFQHPLSPSVRIWYLKPFMVSELIEIPSEKKKARASKKEIQKDA